MPGRSEPPTARAPSSSVEAKTVAEKDPDKTAPLGPRPSAPSASPASAKLRLPAPGDRIDDRYVVEKLLGSGGMAHVFAADDEVEKRKVALKVLDVELAANHAARERFAREASAMAALVSKNTVRVYAVGEIPPGLPYMTMELLEGKDLGAVLIARGPVPHGDACEWLAQACDAVAEAHAAGIIHRDLKPRNMFLSRGTVRVLDFGIARAVGGVLGKLQTLTHAGDIVGTMAYASPEQIKSPKHADARADIWSLGACLYRLVTGELPFSGENEIDIMKAVFEREPTPIAATRPELPEAVTAVVKRCLAKDPAQRFQTAAELGAALRAAAAEPAKKTGLTGTVLLDAPVRVPAIMTSVAPSNPTAPSQRKQQQRALVIGIGAGVAVFFVAVLLFMLLIRR